MEKYIAIDNVCAWPNLTLMPNGDIVATIFNQPTHGRWEGDVECWGSRDGGKIWEKRGVPAPHEPGTNRMNVAAGLAKDGSLIVIASGWTNRPPAPVGNEEPNYEKQFGESRNLVPWVCRSTDGGYTWTQEEGIDFSECMEGDTYHPIPFGDIITLSDGRLAVTVYSCSSLKSGVHLLYSDDDGRSWGNESTIIKGDLYHNETALLSPDGKKILAAIRCEGKAVLDLFISNDLGRTWEYRFPVTLGSRAPGHLLKLANGDILLTYGIRNKGFHGVGVRISSDEGETWKAPAYLVDFEGDVDGTYPASVQLDDGTIVTAYYRKHAPEHNRYHMGVVRWRLDEFY